MYADATDTVETSIELLREFEQTGDAAVFEIFMRRHATMVYATCLKVTRDPHDAEDATQATFLTLASKSRLNGEIRQPEAWLRKVAHRLSLDLIRSKKRRVNRENARSEMSDEAAPLDSHDHADKGEVKGILNEELAKLPASYRMPLVLHYFGGLSRDEMAAQLKLKPSTLGVRLHRAREQLRKRLANRGVVLPSVALTALLVESVHFAISERLVAATALQASAIVVGQSMNGFGASAAGWTPTVGMIQSISDVIARSKVKLIASVVVLGSAMGATNAQVQKLLPAVVREWLPSLSMPSLTVPRFEHLVPMPKLTAQAMTPAAIESTPTRSFAWTSRPMVATVPSATLAVAAKTTASGGPSAPFESTLVPASAATWAAAPAATLARVDVGLDTRRPVDAGRSSSAAEWTTLPTFASARSSGGESRAASVASIGSARRESGGWGTVIGDGTAGASRAGNGPAAPGGGEVDAGDLPENLVASVVGTSPLSSGGGGGGGGGGGSSKSDDRTTIRPQGVVASPSQTRTIVFAGTRANYGGYSDDAWKASPIVDLSDTIEPIKDAPVGPVAPSSALSVNGARVTLHGVSADATATVAFLDTNSTAYPTLPSGHHFIGAWSLETSEPFSSADLLVRYDDLRAARMNLSEQILKLWVSDGVTWTLMLHDPTFGRDVNENLMWVTAAGGFKYFAASAPEPSTIAVVTFGLISLATRRRRRGVKSRFA